MEVWHQVAELPPKEKGFQVYHRRLKISKQGYRSAMADFPQPFKEEGFQDFVARYLQAKGDLGVVGMVRVEESEDNLILDAAVRYPTVPENERSDRFWTS